MLAKVRPADVLAALMFPQWTYQPGEKDLTVMRIEARGVKAGAATTIRWDLYDELDGGDGLHEHVAHDGVPGGRGRDDDRRGKAQAPGRYGA